MNRNITLSLPVELIKKAKVRAAENDTTINCLVRQLLEDQLMPRNEAREAGERLLALAGKGPYFKGNPSLIRREDLYER